MEEERIERRKSNLLPLNMKIAEIIFLEVADLRAFVELSGKACAYNAQHRGLSHRYPQAYSQDEKKRN